MTTKGTALLDVNVLVALAWPNHQHHKAAREWFTERSTLGWATTPVTQGGFVRVSSNRALSPAVTTPSTAIELLRRLAETPGHVFWPDTVDRVVGRHIDAARLTGYRQVTDAHLLAVALENRGRLVTFDTGVRALADDESTVEILTGA